MSKFSPEAFRKACGDIGSMGLLAEEPIGPGARFLFRQQPYAMVGRSKGNDIVLNDHRISRRHAYLQILNGSVFCVDLNGSRFAGWLSPMHSVRLGSCTLRLIAESPAANPFEAVDPLAAGALENPYITLEFLNGRKGRAEWSVDRPLTLLGTASWCKLRLHDPNVAPIHASLVCTHEGAWVVDLLSLSGVYLNGERVRLARLEDKDELRIGDFTMRVNCRPTTNLLTQAVALDSQHEPARGQITTLDHEPPATKIALQSTRQSSPVVQGYVDPSLKAMMDSVFFPMVQQISAVQNQMFDHFQQAMGSMFQMFGTLQKEQIEVLRGELDRVQQLTREIQAIQMELKGSPGSVASQPFGMSRPARGTPSAPLAEREGRLRVGQVNGAPAEQTQFNQARQAANLLDEKSAENTQRNPTDVHALLCERMAELQEDRRSRIQKMVDFLSKK